MRSRTIYSLLTAALLLGTGLAWLKHHHRQAGESAKITPSPVGVETNAADVNVTAATEAAKAQAARAVITPAIQSIVIPDSHAASHWTEFSARVKAIQALDRALTTEEIGAFYEYLLSPAHASADERKYENWLRNEMLNKLVTQPVLPTGLANLLVGIYGDASQDIVMRDYAVQYIAPAYAGAGSDDKALLSQTLWQAAAETDSSIAGTALLALNILAQDHEEFPKDKIAGTALKLAGDQSCGELARITAIQICGRMRVTQAGQLVLALAQNTGSVPLRLSAVAALGDIGDAQSEVLLQQIATGSDERLRIGAESALARLRRRLGN